MSNLIVTKMVDRVPFFQFFQPSMVLFEKIKMDDPIRYTTVGRARRRNSVEKSFEERGDQWLALLPSVNPYSSVLFETPLADRAVDVLIEVFTNRIISYWGVGNGDIEIKMLIPFMAKAENHAQIIPIEAVDLNPLFLDYFFTGICSIDLGCQLTRAWERHELLEEWKNGRKFPAIYCRGIHGFFQNYIRKQVRIQGIPYVIILVGNTLSNFPSQEQFAEQITNFMEPGDYLVLGVRQAIDTKYLIDLYRHNPWVHAFIGAEMGTVDWIFDTLDTIKAIDSRGRERFITRSYTVERLRSLFSQLVMSHHWTTIDEDELRSFATNSSMDRWRYPLRLGSILAIFQKL